MKFSQVTASALIALAALTIVPAYANTILYADSASFMAATNATDSEGFSHITLPDESITSFHRTFGISYSGNVYAADANYDPAISDWGTGSVLLGGPGAITLDFETPINAFAADIGTYSPYGATVSFTTSGPSFVVNTHDYPNLTFFGFSSDTMFSEIVITADAGYLVMDNVTTAVPEPATWALLLIGFGGIGYAMRNRRDGSRAGTYSVEGAAPIRV